MKPQFDHVPIAYQLTLEALTVHIAPHLSSVYPKLSELSGYPFAQEH